MSHGFGCRTLQSAETGLLEMNVTAEECHAKGGEIEPLFQWIEGKWIGGKLLRTGWIPRKLVNGNELALTLNFTDLSNAVSLPLAYNTLFTLQNQV